MNEAQIVDQTLKALQLILLLSMPVLVVAVVVGIGVSLVQSLTQIQDQTLSFGIKLVAVFLTIMLTMRWAGTELARYADEIFTHFPYYMH